MCRRSAWPVALQPVGEMAPATAKRAQAVDLTPWLLPASLPKGRF